MSATKLDPQAVTPASPDPSAAAPARVRYQVASVEETEVPAGGEGQTWYRYVIEGGYGQLTGCRPGTQAQITDYANQLAADLNSRSGARSPSPWASRSKK